MFRNICTFVCINKNMLMFISAFVYILALFASFSGLQILIGLLFTLFLIFLMNYIPPKYILIWGFVFCLGIFNTSLRLKITDDILNIAPVNSVIYGKVISIPQSKTDKKLQFFFKVNKIEYDNTVKTFDDEKVLVTLSVNSKMNLYDYYKIKGRLSYPFKAGNPSQFDYGNYLRNYNTYAVFYGKEIQGISGERTKLETALRKINDYREEILKVHSHYLKSPNLEILGGIVFGDDAVSPPENIRQSFINSGLLHILAASGMNVAFIFSFFFFFLSVFKVPYKVNISVCILMIIIYSMMTGLGASVIRAGLMLIFVLIGKLIDRDAHSISLLSFIAFLMLLYNPMYINDVGFQLSFIVTFGLLIMSPYIIRSKNRIINWIAGTVFIPIIAQLWVIPIQIFYFNNISLYSVFANIMSVPILSVISFGGFVSSLISVISPLAEIVCKCFDFVLNPLITILINISDFWGRLPHSAIQTSHPNIFQIILYYLILLNITAFFNSDLRAKFSKFLKAALISLILILSLTNINISDKTLEITAFDVGNADSFLIKTPDSRYIMIDTAKSGYNGGKSQAEFIILKYLKDRGIKNLDTVIVTHFDNDHCGGASDIMNDLNTGKIYLNSLKNPSRQAQNIYKTACRRGTKIIPAQNKQIVFDKDGLKITNYISPESKETDDNESSIISLLEYKNFKMLFTGDASAQTLRNTGYENFGRINVLKVGHHGASGAVSNELLKRLNPQVSLISVGENKFGHPSIYTIALLRKTEIIRTDIHNSLRLRVYDDCYDILSYDPASGRYKKIKTFNK